MTIREQVGDRLRRLRLTTKYDSRLGYRPQANAAKAVLITQASLSNYETGKREVPLVTALRLAALYGVEITAIATTKDLKDG